MATLSSRRLEETAELGRALVSGLSGAGLLVADTALRVQAVDGEIYDSLGYEHCVGRLVRDVIPAAAWESLAPRYHAALGGRVQSFHYDAVSVPSVHSVRIAPIHDGADVIGVMVLSEDITATVATTRSLSDSERLQRSVLEVLDEGVIVVDLDGNLVQANNAAGVILDTDLSLAGVDRDWWRPFAARHAGDGSTLNVGATVLATGRGVRDVQVYATRPDGSKLALSINCRPLRDQAGAVSGLVLSLRDVTGREEEHGRLIDSEDRLREAHVVARLASWELAPDTEEVLIFQALAQADSDAGARTTLGRLLEPMSPREREVVHADLAAMVAGGSDEAVSRSRRLYPTGPVWIETRSRAVRDVDGRLLCIRGTSQDVTDQELAKLEAARARDFFQATLDSLSAHIAVLDDHGDIVMTNRSWADFAVENDGPPTGPGASYLAACDGAKGDRVAARVAAGLRSIISGEQDELSLEYPCHSPSTERWFALRAARFEGPGQARVVVSHENVTERRQAEREVATQAALLDEVDVAVIAADPEGRITHFNRGAELLYGWTSTEALGRDGVALISPPGTIEVSEFRRSGDRETRLTVCRKDGSTFPAALRSRERIDVEGRPAGRINVSVDMSERVASERALLAARNYMQALADSIGEGLMTIDTQGRVIYMNEAAEQLLGWSEDALRGRVMHEVVHAHRPDGSEFPIEDCPIIHARRDRQTVRIEDDLFFRRDGSPVPVAYTASPFETEDGVEGCVVVFEEISERKAREENLQREADKLSWIGRIQDALAEGRFMLYAQPIVDLHSDGANQYELLLRMQAENGEIIPPDAYLPIAEEYGLIGDVDRWVIERGTEVAATGRPVQINLSAQSVGDQSVLGHIEMCIEKNRVDPARLVFEITETAILSDEDAARIFAERLRALGCKLALDDFGTGYGGFTYLKQLPLDFLKIDIQFVRDLVSNPGSRHVVEAVVSLAAGFGLQTIAEGVEDSETYDLLSELGVDLAQGYHIARPGPLEAAAARTDSQEDLTTTEEMTA